MVTHARPTPASKLLGTDGPLGAWEGHSATLAISLPPEGSPSQSHKFGKEFQGVWQDRPKSHRGSIARNSVGSQGLQHDRPSESLPGEGPLLKIRR